MEIYIETNNIIDDIGGTFLMETGGSNPIPPRGILVQRINESASRLVSLLSRFTSIELRRSADDGLQESQAFIFELVLSARKASGKSQAIADQIHSFLVNAALSKIYPLMNLADLAKNHEALASADAENINTLLHTKLPPI